MPIRLPAVPAVLALCTLAACSATGAERRPDPSPTSLTVREITIVDERGVPRVRIGAPLPDPKGLKRAVRAVGIQLMDPEGKEIGGLAMLEPIGVNGLCFDSDEGYEAMCMGLVQGKPNITFRHDWKERISLGVEEGGIATVVLSDAEGKPHLRLEVAKDGTARVNGVPATPPGTP
ncbi:MAG TPA: hypothetical protein VD838_23280 [Anaeromyxobacteraceae bacterium]|nr:hypothetical protein [Anaeromyxobacteraceae bacterium]